MTYPTELGLLNEGGDAGEVGPLQYLCVRNLVLPPDVKEVSEASLVEMVDLPFVSSVGGPGLTAI